WVLAHETFGDVDKALIDGRDGAPILVLCFLEAHFQVGNDVMVARLPNLVPNLLGLRTVDEVLPEPLDDLLQVILGVFLGAVVVDQVLDHEAGKLIDTRVDGEPLVDNFASERLFESFVHSTLYRSSFGTMPMIESSLLSSRRRMRLVSKVISMALWML